MREERLINRGWQFALLPCAPVNAETANWKVFILLMLTFHMTGQ